MSVVITAVKAVINAMSGAAVVLNASANSPVPAIATAAAGGTPSYGFSARQNVPEENCVWAL